MGHIGNRIRSMDQPCNIFTQTTHTVRNAILTQNMILNPNIKYLMQQPTSWTLKCFPDMLALDNRILLMVFNDGEKKSPTD